MWKDPVFLASYRVRIRFHTDGTLSSRRFAAVIVSILGAG